MQTSEDTRPVVVCGAQSRDKASTDVVIVTGSSGLIGASTVRRLARRLRVVGFDRAGNARQPKEAECVCVDVTSDKSVHAGLERVRYVYGDRIASVIHLAAYYDFSGEPSPKYEEITVRGTERLLRELKHFSVEQFIFSSTMLVHKPSEPGQRITEEAPVEPAWDYPKSKVTTEELLRANRGTIPILLLRVAGVYDDQCHSIPLAHQIQRIYERQIESRLFPGDPTQGRQSFVHLEDLIDSFERAIDRRQQLPPELVILIGESGALSYAELQDEIGCALYGREWKTREISAPLARTGAWLEEKLPLGKEPFIKPWMIDLADDNYELDISRAHAVLDWEPRRSLRESIPRMVAALKADPARWYHENKLARPRGTHGEQRSGKQAEVKTTHHEAMSSGEHEAMMREHHQKYLWSYLANVILGFWLIADPVTTGRSLDAYSWSDITSGSLLVLFGLLSLNPRRTWAPWGSCFAGIWLLFAPLVFWAPHASSYTIETIIGALAIALSVLIPGMPGMMEMPGAEIPPGWSYNPSSWLQRTPMIGLAFVGFFLSRYLAAFQLHHIPSAWDPFFGDGTTRVLTSKVSKAWPISDAGLGSLSYLLEALSGFMGDSKRWRTMPWMVLMFGLLVIPLGVTSIVLVVLQPVMVGAWCTICLVTAAAMLIMIPLTLDEVVAMTQFVLQAKREGKPLWSTFWMGGSIEGEKDARTPEFDGTIGKGVSAMVWGMSVPWNLALSALAGLWLMFAPAVLANGGRAADSDHLFGALIITFAVIAMGEVGRPLRLLNVLFGAWLIIAPFVLAGHSEGGRWSDIGTGLLVIALSLRRGPVREHYGTWDRWI